MNIKVTIAIALTLLITACSDSNVVATVGDNDVTKQDFKNYLALKGITSTSQASRVTLIEEYTSRLALTQSVEESGNIELDKINRQVEDYRQQLVLNAYFDKFIEKNVNDEAVKNYYGVNAEKFEEIKVHVAHILFRTRQGMTDEEIQVTKMKAYEAKGKLSKGQAFTEVAEAMSEDRLSGKKGGDLGWINKGSIDPKFSDVAFELAEGEVSEPVRTAYGFHVLKVLESPKTIKQSFNEVKGQIRHELKSKAKATEVQRLIDRTNVEIHQDNLKSL